MEIYKCYGIYDGVTGKWYRGSNQFGDKPKLYQTEGHAKQALTYYLDRVGHQKNGSSNREFFSIYVFDIHVRERVVTYSGN